MRQDIFHVHTKRCGHATEEDDFQYIEKAISLGAASITFTDHAPFPGDPFGHRMLYEQLPEYIATLKELKEKYKNHIDVFIGLELEYLKSFESYYKSLRENNNINILLLGQHFYEVEPGYYSFWEPKEVIKTNEAIFCTQAIVDGVKTGYFDAIAHPDRIFRRRRKWGEEESFFAKQIINVAREYNIPLEENESSKTQWNYFRPEFWKLCGNNKVIHGLDAHSVDEIKLI